MYIYAPIAHVFSTGSLVKAFVFRARPGSQTRASLRWNEGSELSDGALVSFFNCTVHAEDVHRWFVVVRTYSKYPLRCQLIDKTRPFQNGYVFRPCNP